MSRDKHIVYFFSDFGPNGPYTGQVEAVVREKTRVDFINLISNAPVADPFHSAYLLNAIYRTMPVKSGYLLAVVDPGVGSERRVVQFQINDMVFLGPDNGLFSRLIKTHDVELVTVLPRPAQLKSDSFDARDWFAPELVRLISARQPGMKTLKVNELIGEDWPDEIAEIIYIDHYGNLVTGLNALGIDSSRHLLINGHEISYARTFSEMPVNTLFWYRNSMGLIEVAANRSSASMILHASIGDKFDLL